MQFVVDLIETQLLSRVDELTNQELQGRFQVADLASDPHVARIERMNGEVLNGMKQLVHQQASIWQATISPDNSQLLTVDSDDIATLWGLQDPNVTNQTIGPQDTDHRISSAL